MKEYIFKYLDKKKHQHNYYMVKAYGLHEAFNKFRSLVNLEENDLLCVWSDDPVQIITGISY